MTFLIMMTISLGLIKPKIGNTEERITGQTCGKQEYTDWPCLDEKGCILLNDERSLKEYLLDKTINHHHDDWKILSDTQSDKQ